MSKLELYDLQLLNRMLDVIFYVQNRIEFLKEVLCADSKVIKTSMADLVDRRQ